jgi:hypothetical protein
MPYDPEVTQRVLDEVAEHRVWQAERYHDLNQTMPHGVGPGIAWMPGLVRSAANIERACRADWDYDRDPDPALMSWLKLLREEVVEAFSCPTTACLRTELVQIAAVAVAWIEKIDGETS